MKRDFYDDYEESFIERSGLKQFLKRTGISAFWGKCWKIIATAMIVPVLAIYLPAFLQKEVRSTAPGFLICAGFMWIFWLVDIWFPRFFFLLKYGISVENPEPTEWYLFTQKVSWVVLPMVMILLLLLSLR